MASGRGLWVLAAGRARGELGETVRERGPFGKTVHSYVPSHLSSRSSTVVVTWSTPDAGQLAAHGKISPTDGPETTA